jgi:hypothetical protein
MVLLKIFIMYKVIAYTKINYLIENEKQITLVNRDLHSAVYNHQ